MASKSLHIAVARVVRARFLDVAETVSAEAAVGKGRFELLSGAQLADSTAIASLLSEVRLADDERVFVLPRAAAERLLGGGMFRLRLLGGGVES